MTWQAFGTMEGIGGCRTALSCRQTGELATNFPLLKLLVSKFANCGYRWIHLSEGLHCLFDSLCLEEFIIVLI